MKEIEYFIESNKKIKEQLIEEYNCINPNEENELKRLEINIERVDYYIKGLEDAKKYIESEGE